MARINLLPWREGRRRQLTQEFARQAVLVAVFAAAVGGYGWYHMRGLVEHQQARNEFLQDEIKVLQNEIKEIQKLESTRKQLLARMNIIQRLQQQRPQIVHLFFEVADTLPDGVYLTSLQQKSDRLTVRGRAESNARVSAYMRNLDASPWLRDPELEVIETDKADRVNAFTLHLSQSTPDDEAEDGETTTEGS